MFNATVIAMFQTVMAIASKNAGYGYLPYAPNTTLQNQPFFGDCSRRVLISSCNKQVSQSKGSLLSKVFNLFIVFIIRLAFLLNLRTQL